MGREIQRRAKVVLLSVLVIWGLAVIVAAETGVYQGVYPVILAGVIALGVVVPVIVYATSSAFRGYIEAIGLRSLTGFHVWRIAAALVFFWYGAQNLLPEAFVRNAGWGDLIAGLMALGVMLLPKTRNRYLAFHIFGFADFVVAVGTGLTFFLLDDPRMSGIETLPMALIPFYGVGISGASHIMAFDLMRRGLGSEVKSAVVQA
ncbi:permease [Bradyrhizobium australafricanum]|uniref:permease n=1 Tax=Bradyrhizobium australafricanum TaxID=2821406 RepID=UPI001CE32798|nr:permease [Bradyrhizobium australafricanum]MCA6100534.1 permease [Bradyrhizobium australafricanum]